MYFDQCGGYKLDKIKSPLFDIEMAEHIINNIVCAWETANLKSAKLFQPRSIHLHCLDKAATQKENKNSHFFFSQSQIG